MLTPQEVSARSFTKTVMGGYSMTMVDEFLDELTDDYTSLYKENTSLKAKMKVLADKVEEYRATEEAMRRAMLSAQKTADEMVAAAQTQAEDRAAAEELHAVGKEHHPLNGVFIGEQALKPVGDKAGQQLVVQL